MRNAARLSPTPQRRPRVGMCLLVQQNHSLFQRALLRAKRISAVLELESGDGESDGGNSITFRTRLTTWAATFSGLRRTESSRAKKKETHLSCSARHALHFKRQSQATSDGRYSCAEARGSAVLRRGHDPID